ncbi:MAG: hypothetical protein ACI4TT_01420, partial [Christensenellales bacterium]
MAKSKKKVKKDERVNSYSNNFQPNDSYFSAPIDTVKNSSAENYTNFSKKGKKDGKVYAKSFTADTKGETANYTNVTKKGGKDKKVYTASLNT